MTTFKRFFLGTLAMAALTTLIDLPEANAGCRPYGGDFYQAPRVHAPYAPVHAAPRYDSQVFRHQPVYRARPQYVPQVRHVTPGYGVSRHGGFGYDSRIRREY